MTATPETEPRTHLEPRRANLWRACVIWQLRKGNDAAVQALRAIDPWQAP